MEGTELATWAWWQLVVGVAVINVAVYPIAWYRNQMVIVDIVYPLMFVIPMLTLLFLRLE